jgi:hypothetical protein
MENPLDENQFKHYLKFISLGRTDLYEICEPVGFDAANFIKEQEDKRYARSIEYGSLDKLDFVDGFGVYISTPQIINQIGDISNYLDYGLQWLLYIYKQYGFQSKVEYILEKSGVQFSYGMLDFTEPNITDGYTYISCKLIQKNKVADLKRRIDDSFNAFGTKNAKQEDITPIPVENLLVKGLVIPKFSNWISPGEFTGNTTAYSVFGTQTENYRWNNCKDPVADGIDDTLTFLPGFIAPADYNNPDINSFKYIKAKRELFDVKIKISDFRWYQEVAASQGGNGYCSNSFSIFWGLSFETRIGEIQIIDRLVNGTEYMDIIINETYTIPYLPSGMYIFIVLNVVARQSSSFGGQINGRNVQSRYNIDINVNEKSLDQVIKASRWIDLIKQSSLFSSGLPVVAPLFDVNGEHYNNMVFNRKMVSQDITNFYCTTKNAMESIQEVNCDYEPDDTNIYIGHQKDFYKNVEIASFNIIPSEDFTIQENERCSLNKLKFGYKTFEQDRTTKDTDLAIHTELELLIQNDNVEQKIERQIEFTRDPLSIQKIVDLENTAPTTSTEEDDKVYIANVSQLAPNSFNEFGIVLGARVFNNKLEILSRTLNDSSETPVINWLNFGLSVGIIVTVNSINYTCTAITRTLLTLTPVGSTPNYSGDTFFKIKYFFTNVNWTTRTAQDFAVGDFPNQYYSIKRNLINYYSELLSASLIYSKKDLIVSYFKSNGTYKSRLNSESQPVIENAIIPYASLKNPLTTAKMYNIKTIANFQDVLNYLEAYKINRGFVRTFDANGRVIKGFVKNLNHNWSENSLELMIEELYETEFLKITIDGNIVNVNDAPYDMQGVAEWFITKNDFIQLYDKKSNPLSNYYRYDFVLLNGVKYNSITELVTQLNTVVWT